MTIEKQGRTPKILPFDMRGVVRDERGILRYEGLPSSLVDMFRESVERWGDDEALVELGGERLTYRQFWDRSAAVAGGLRALGIANGRPGRHPARERERLGCRVLGDPAARRDRGARQHPLHRERGGVRRHRLRGELRVRAGRAAARRHPGRRRRRRAHRRGGDLLHQRDDRLPQGRDDHARELPRRTASRASGSCTSRTASTSATSSPSRCST